MAGGIGSLGVDAIVPVVDTCAWRAVAAARTHLTLLGCQARGTLWTVNRHLHNAYWHSETGMGFRLPRSTTSASRHDLGRAAAPTMALQISVTQPPSSKTARSFC